MKGSYRILVQNATVRYDFEIKRNITIIKGDSATGKTTLVEMIREYYENGEASGISLTCEKICTTLEGRDWKVLLATMQERIIFIDEGNDFVHTKEFAKTIQKTNNYYVIVTREGLVNLPYSVEEIYGIRESGKYAMLRQTYQELYRIYGNINKREKFIPAKIIVEDSNAGFDFYKSLSENGKWKVESAQGKSNIFTYVAGNAGTENILVIADGAAFGPEMDRMIKLLKEKQNVALYLPESFEWIILKSEIIEDREIKQILSNSPNYIESSIYFSWERYFTALLTEKTAESYLKYSKKKLNKAYMRCAIREKICRHIDGIELT